jgi:transcription antitermination factor NusG
MSQSQMTLPWYALRVKTRGEQLAASALTMKGYDVFLPQYRSRRRWSDRVKEVDLPLFAGYLFCRLDVNRRLPVLTSPGVLQLVGTGNAFYPVDDQEIAVLQSIVTSQVAAEPWPFLRVGQTVRIDHGPLAGLQGLLVSLKKPYRLIVSVTLLQRSVAVELDHDWVSSIEPQSVGLSAVAI